MSGFVLTLLGAALVSWLATAILARLAPALGWLDAPTMERKEQERPVPPVGGAAILLGWSSFALAGALGHGSAFEAPFGLSTSAVCATLLLAFAIGSLDDLRRSGLGPAAKLGLQALAATPLAAAAAVRFGVEPFTAVAAFLAALGLAVAAMNLANTFDHADGALGSVSALGLFLAGAPAAAGAALGFLPWNLNGARQQARGRRARASTPSAYLGDAGSHLLGVLLLLHPAAWPAFLLPAVDLVRLAIVRTRRGSRPWIGDRSHLSHRLQALGLAPRGVALCLALLSLPALVGASCPPAPGAGVSPGILAGTLVGMLAYAWILRGLARAAALRDPASELPGPIERGRES